MEMMKETVNIRNEGITREMVTIWANTTDCFLEFFRMFTG